MWSRYSTKVLYIAIYYIISFIISDRLFSSQCYLTDIIQHPQSNVVSLPATILTATVTGTPGTGVSVPPPGVHIPSHAGPLVPSSQAQVYD